MSMSRKDIRSWLVKQALWQVHIPVPKEIHHPHYDVTKPNEQHQFDLLYMPHNVFEGNTYKYILTDINVASRYKVARPLGPKHQVKLHLCWKQSIKRVTCLNIPRYFNVIAHTAFVEAFNKELAELLFKPMNAQELQDPEMVLIIWVRNLNKIVNKMNSTISSMIGMKPKDAIKLNTVLLDKKYPEEIVLDEDGLYRYLYQPGEQYGDQKRRATDFIWSKNTYQLDRILQEPGNRILYYLQDGPDGAFVHEELVRISEDTQAIPEWASEKK